MPTMTVCKGCGIQMEAIDKNGKPACPICLGISPDNSVPMEIEMPDSFTCVYCKKTTPTEELLRQWKHIPFAEPSKRKYYCGCRGWD